MSILESVAQGLGVEINKQFQVYDQEGNHVAAAVFRLDRSGCQLLVTPKSETCIDPDTVLGGLISGNLVPKTRVLDHCPFCGGRNALVQRMRFTRGGTNTDHVYRVLPGLPGTRPACGIRRRSR